MRGSGAERSHRVGEHKAKERNYAVIVNSSTVSFFQEQAMLVDNEFAAGQSF